MKPQEAELVSEISKLQCMVTELKTGFSGALLELSQIQHGDSFLREELEENRRSCQKKALHLEVLVESLREELAVMQQQILQLHSSRQTDGSSDDAACERGCDCPLAPPTCLSRGKLLLHCFLQGLKAGLSEGTDARHQVSMQLLNSEWDYVSSLNQLYDKYKTPPAHQRSAEPHQTFLLLVEQLLQRHLLFRNTLQERLSAHTWKSLVGDVLVQLIGHNDTSFSDAYLGYTGSLASFLSLEFSRLNQEMQRGQIESEEMKLLALLLAPVSRIHGYLSHIQNLLQWTSKEHPDCSLLLGSERALRSLLSRCHAILEEDVRWEEGGAAGHSCSESGSSANCCRNQREFSNAAHRDQQDAGLTNGVMRVECWSCSPVRRDRTAQNQPSRDCGHAPCGHAHCPLLTPDPAGWAENSDSGQGTGKGTELEAPHADPEDGDTDPDDTSAFDFSSVTSCSADGTLRRQTTGDDDDEDEEGDSQVPVLLKPSSGRERERSVCLRWQIPRMTPHPPLRPDGPPAPPPCRVSAYGKRLVSVRKGSPPLHPNSAFRPIWDDPSKQADSAPEKDHRHGFVPIQAPARKSFHPSRESLRPGLPQQRGNAAAAVSSRGLWDDSEDSEGPCSTV